MNTIVKPHKAILVKHHTENYYHYSQWHHSRYCEWRPGMIPPNPECFYITEKGDKYICKFCHDRIVENIATHKEYNRIERIKEETRLKETLPDEYVIKKLRQKNKIKVKDINKDLIELKRANMKLAWAIEQKKKPFQKCLKHGSLTIDDCIKSGKSPGGIPRYKCRACMKDLHDQHYKNNKEKVLKKVRDYRQTNPEKIKEIRKKYDEKTREKHRPADNERRKRWKAKDVQELGDVYIKQSLVRGTSLKYSDIPPALVELKRATLKVKLAVKSHRDSDYLLKIQEKLNDRKNKKHRPTEG